MRNALVIALLLAAVVTVATACRDTEPGSAAADVRYDYVTFEQATGNASEWSYPQRDDAPPVTLFAPGFVPDDDAERGQRRLMCYTIEERTTDTQWRVGVRYAQKMIFDSLRVASAESLAARVSEPIQLASIWRTGEFINIDCKVQYTGKARKFYLISDGATLGDATVHLYLIDDLNGAEGSFYRQCYASFFIGAVWRRASCRQVVVHLADTRRPEVTTYTFSKQ